MLKSSLNWTHQKLQRMDSPIGNILLDKLGPEKVIIGEPINERYYHIWRMSEGLQARAVVLPKTTEDVAEALKICHQHQQAVSVHGGRTNMVGSTETSPEEIVISLEKMNQIEEIDEKSRSMTVQAGVILENIQNTAKAKDLLFPLNFGAKGSAQIGGAISTNAGGLRVFKYGMTRSLVLGLEVVLADGTIISSLKKIIKDNSAFDLKQLFIGSEGTLGIVTKAVLKLVEAPQSRVSAFVGFNEYDKVVGFLRYMDSRLAGTLSGFELIWNRTYRAMTAPPAGVKPLLPYDYKYYVLLEGLGSDPENDQKRLEELLEYALEESMILDANIAQGASDLAWFWKMREDVDVLVSQCSNDQHFDISLPIPVIGNFIEKVVAKLQQIPDVELVLPFGHMADGNIHFVIGKRIESKELIKQINDVIYLPLQEVGGSISAEHGIGVHKKAYLHLSRSAAEIQLMKTLKKTMDPNGILNPGKVLD